MCTPLVKPSTIKSLHYIDYVVYQMVGNFYGVHGSYPQKMLNFSYRTVIRIGIPRKYEPTKLSKLPKPQKFKPSKITNCMVAGNAI